MSDILARAKAHMAAPGRPSDDEVDAELEAAIMNYDRSEKYPEWSNAAMREAYRAGLEDGGGSLVPELVAEVERLRGQISMVSILATKWDNARELETGRRSIVAQAFAAELFEALGGAE